MVYGALQGSMGGVLHALALHDHGAQALTTVYSSADPAPVTGATGDRHERHPRSSIASESEIGRTTCVLFMKGTPVFPQCGFSARW